VSETRLLSGADIEAVACRVVELLEERLTRRPGRLVDAGEIAGRHDLRREWVYAHADELGAIRLGAGERPRLRFDPEVVAERLAACSAGRRSQAPQEPAPARKPSRRRRRRTGSETKLLPIRGGGS
jgi:hypothetical protein